jgi:hypothetical protein
MKMSPRELELRAMREAAFWGEKPVMRPVLVTTAMTNSERVRRWRKSRETGE